MILKKQKAVIAALLSAALTAAAVVPATVSAAGTRTKAEKYGDDSYAQRFLSLYDDVITNGVENGYLSGNNIASGGFGVPYHAVEELVVEAPDYGHETTSEAMSYIVWMAAMRDAISKDGSITNPDGSTTTVDSTKDLAKAWKTMEVMIPTVQTGLMTKDQLSATYSPEWEEPEMYYGDNVAMVQGNNGINPIHKYFKNAYSGDSGLYLMHWLADVDDWYGYGGGNGKFTFINTFQRGAQESCWETVPHPSVEEKKYGNSQKGIKGIFKTASEDVPAQWAYTNAPDAEDRAIQAVYAANRWGVGDDSITALAGKMGDQLRNNMFDKYYKKIGANNVWDTANDMSGAHYLMSWYTSWGGAMDGTWAWQIGASHCHEFYQNPLAAFALLQDSGLKSAMKAQDAEKDYKTSLQRQMEFYLWLQSADGPIAGGATSSWNGRYETPQYNADDTKKYGTSTPTKFYEMSYQEHPVYLDPGSNHWIGNQVWAVQRLAEMYYVVKTEGDTTGVLVCDSMTLEEALKAILDRWVEWFVGQVHLYEDGTYDIPATLDWFGQPADWYGKYDPNANKDLTCTVTNVGSSDLGCVSSLCNTLIYYAKANNVDYKAAYSSTNTDVASKGLYIAHSLLDREWELGRDDIGLSITETNGSMARLFEQDVFIPDYYSGTMPNGDPLEHGATFLSFRSKYLQNEKVQEFKTAYDNAKATGGDITEAMESVDLNYHRFWHAGDILLALGTMYELYPQIEPDYYEDGPVTGDELVLTPSEIKLAVGESETIEATVNGSKVDVTFTVDGDAVTVDANGKVTAVKEGTATVTAKTSDGKTATATVTVSGQTTTTDPSGETVDTSVKDAHWGDTNVDGEVSVADVVKLNLYLLNKTANPLVPQGLINANCMFDDNVDSNDSSLIMNYVAMIITYDKLGPQN
ncbi:MAG: Ig-like domain-containing protein [Oscillospiraceae bacterium]|nr:Ig-like domain-containing protein [Oscillospiraceae bacterium]